MQPGPPRHKTASFFYYLNLRRYMHVEARKGFGEETSITKLKINISTQYYYRGQLQNIKAIKHDLLMRKYLLTQRSLIRVDTFRKFCNRGRPTVVISFLLFILRVFLQSFNEMCLTPVITTGRGKFLQVSKCMLLRTGFRARFCARGSLRCACSCFAFACSRPP